MSNVTTEIKVYPDKEMLALDMAEILRSLALYNGAILQGCRLEIPAGTTVVTISSGRMFIRGRLAEVTGGEIPAPTDLSTTQICYIVAVYDPEVANPFYIDIFTSQQKDALDAVINQEFANDSSFDLNFNVSSYKSYMTLATVTIAAGTGAASNLVTNTLNYPHKNNQSVVADQITTVNNTINSKETALNTRINDNASAATAALNAHKTENQTQYNYLLERSYNRLNSTYNTRKLVDYVVPYPTVDVPAGSTVDVSFNNNYGVVHTITISGSAATRGVSWINNGWQRRPAYSPAPSPDDRLFPIAIAAIRFVNAAKGGGKNYQYCVIAGYSFGDDTTHVLVRNTGTSAACIDINTKMLYTTHE